MGSSIYDVEKTVLGVAFSIFEAVQTLSCLRVCIERFVRTYFFLLRRSLRIFMTAMIMLASVVMEFVITNGIFPSRMP